MNGTTSICWCFSFDEFNKKDPDAGDLIKNTNGQFFIFSLFLTLVKSGKRRREVRNKSKLDPLITKAHLNTGWRWTGSKRRPDREFRTGPAGGLYRPEASFLSGSRGGYHNPFNEAKEKRLLDQLKPWEQEWIPCSFLFILLVVFTDDVPPQKYFYPHIFLRHELQSDYQKNKQTKKGIYEYRKKKVR